MPTGYTADIVSGKITTVKEFAKLCMRNFGATIHMRDDNLNAPYKPIVPSEYHKEQIANTLYRIELLENTPLEDILKEEQDIYANNVKDARTRIDEKNKLRETLKAFIKEVKATKLDSDYDNLKAFMLEQLNSTLSHDTSTDYYEDLIKESSVELIDAERIKNQKLAQLNENLAYHRKSYLKEIESCDKCNHWVKKLYTQLGISDEYVSKS